MSERWPTVLSLSLSYCFNVFFTSKIAAIFEPSAFGHANLWSIRNADTLLHVFINSFSRIHFNLTRKTSLLVMETEHQSFSVK